MNKTVTFEQVGTNEYVVVGLRNTVKYDIGQTLTKKDVSALSYSSNINIVIKGGKQEETAMQVRIA